MADERGAKVEKWKLSKEHLDFQKKFKDLMKARKALELLSLMEQQRQQTLSQAWEELMISYDGLAQEAPESPVRGQQGMEFAQEESQSPMAGMGQPGMGQQPEQEMGPEQGAIRY